MKKIFHILIFSVSIIFLFNANFCIYKNNVNINLVKNTFASYEQHINVNKLSEYDVTAKGFIFNDTVAGMFQGMLGLIILAIKMMIATTEYLCLTFTQSLWDVFESGGALYNGWANVRDILNIFFIFFLLFSAFATVFQISAYHIRSTWVMIVVMALLVNFSWPVSRIIIDISNVTMYFLLGSDSEKADKKMEEKMVKLAENAKINNVIEKQMGAEDNKIKITKASISKIMAFVLIADIAIASYAGLVITIALIFLLRIVALAFLIILSPVGFVFAAFPTTKSYATKWWSSFIGYCIQGPVVLFFLIIGFSILTSLIPDMGNESGFGAFTIEFVIVILFMSASVKAGTQFGSSITNAIIQKTSGAIKGLVSGYTKTSFKLKDRHAGFLSNGALKMASFGAFKGKSRPGDGIAKIHGMASGYKQKFKNADDKYKERYENTRGDMAARTEARGFGGGVDEDVIRKYENKVNYEKMEKLKKSGATGNDIAKSISEAKNAGDVRARLNFAMREKLNDEGMDALVKNYKKFDDDQKREIKNKLVESGKSHKLVEAGHIKIDDLVDNMNPENLAKHKDAFNHVDRKIVEAFENRVNNLTLEGKIKFKDAAGTKLSKRFIEKKEKNI